MCPGAAHAIHRNHTASLHRLAATQHRDEAQGPDLSSALPIWQPLLGAPRLAPPPQEDIESLLFPIVIQPRTLELQRLVRLPLLRPVPMVQR